MIDTWTFVHHFFGTFFQGVRQMLSRNLRQLTGAVAFMFAGAIPLMSANARSPNITYEFTGGTDGAMPWSSLTPDSFGNVYGTTSSAGSSECECGTVFKLNSSGSLATIHTFTGGGVGHAPTNGVSLIRGILYGGALSEDTGTYSLLFSMNTDGSSYTVLHQFTGPDGGVFTGQLQPLANGDIFGLTENGGFHDDGTLYAFRPNGPFAVAHQFLGGADGKTPNALLEDSKHTMFGSTSFGGGCTVKNGGCGTVFEYQPQTRTYSIIYTFQGTTDGTVPRIGAFASDGTIYGNTASGGSNGLGTLFALHPTNQGYSYELLASIQGEGTGSTPNAAPTLTSDGSLIGMTERGFFYEYANGKYVQSTTQSSVDPLAPLFSPAHRPHYALATSYSGGLPCGSGFQTCGVIFSFSDIGADLNLTAIKR